MLITISRARSRCRKVGTTFRTKFARATRFCGNVPKFRGYHRCGCRKAIRDICLASKVAVRLVTSNVRLPTAVLQLTCGLGKIRGAYLIASTLTCTTTSKVRVASPGIVVRSNMYGVTSRSSLTNDVTAVSMLMQAVMGTNVPLTSTIQVTSRAPTQVVKISSQGKTLRGSVSTSILVLSERLGVQTT